MNDYSTQTVYLLNFIFDSLDESLRFTNYVGNGSYTSFFPFGGKNLVLLEGKDINKAKRFKTVTLAKAYAEKYIHDNRYKNTSTHYAISKATVDADTNKIINLKLIHEAYDFRKENIPTPFNPDSITPTGLLDCNRNPIYLGDTVTLFPDNENSITGEVVFECGAFGIYCENYIDWKMIENQIEPTTGCQNRLYACENDNFISLWEIYWNFNDLDSTLNNVKITKKD